MASYWPLRKGDPMRPRLGAAVWRLRDRHGLRVHQMDVMRAALALALRDFEARNGASPLVAELKETTEAGG
jgi:phage baseplate assembly protein W